MNAQTRAAKVNQYASVGLQTKVSAATPHKLVEMLLEGALTHMLAARHHLERGNVAEKGRQISLAIAIVEGLRGSLDRERGGEVAASLDSLYEYIIRSLLQANLHNDTARLLEVHGLLDEVRVGWAGIGEQQQATPRPPAVEEQQKRANRSALPMMEADDADSAPVLGHVTA